MGENMLKAFEAFFSALMPGLKDAELKSQKLQKGLTGLLQALREPA